MSLEEFELLETRIVPFARRMLSEDGCLTPIACTLSSTGELAPVPRIELKEILDWLRERAAAKQICAAAWCIDSGEALVMFFESADGQALAHVIVYRDGVFDQPYGDTHLPEVFV